MPTEYLFVVDGVWVDGKGVLEWARVSDSRTRPEMPRAHDAVPKQTTNSQPQHTDKHTTNPPVAKESLPLLSLALAAIQPPRQLPAASNSKQHARVEGVCLQRVHIPAQRLAAVCPAVAHVLIVLCLLMLLLRRAEHSTNLCRNVETECMQQHERTRHIST